MKINKNLSDAIIFFSLFYILIAVVRAIIITGGSFKVVFETTFFGNLGGLAIASILFLITWLCFFPNRAEYFGKKVNFGKEIFNYILFMSEIIIGWLITVTFLTPIAMPHQIWVTILMLICGFYLHLSIKYLKKC